MSERVYSKTAAMRLMVGKTIKAIRGATVPTNTGKAFDLTCIEFTDGTSLIFETAECESLDYATVLISVGGAA